MTRNVSRSPTLTAYEILKEKNPATHIAHKIIISSNYIQVDHLVIFVVPIVF